MMQTNTASRRWHWFAVAGLLLIPAAAFFVFGAKRAAPMKDDQFEAKAPSQELEGKFQAMTGAANSRRVERSDPKEARRLLRQKLARDPRDVSALSELSQKLLNDENHKEARELALACLQLSPGNKQCDSVRRHALEPRDSKATLESLERCLAENPDSVPCLGGTVVEHIREGDTKAAERAAARLSAIDPESRLALISSGRVRAALGDYSGARAAFEKACALKDEYACFRADALRAEGW